MIKACYIGGFRFSGFQGLSHASWWSGCKTSLLMTFPTCQSPLTPNMVQLGPEMWTPIGDTHTHTHKLHVYPSLLRPRKSLLLNLKIWSQIFPSKLQILRLIVQLPKDLMDWVSRRLCYVVGDADRSVSWTSVYSLIRRTCPGGDGVCTHVNSRRKALLYRDSNLQPDLSLKLQA